MAFPHLLRRGVRQSFLPPARLPPPTSCAETFLPVGSIRRGLSTDNGGASVDINDGPPKYYKYVRMALNSIFVLFLVGIPGQVWQRDKWFSRIREMNATVRQQKHQIYLLERRPYRK